MRWFNWLDWNFYFSFIGRNCACNVRPSKDNGYEGCSLGSNKVCQHLRYSLIFYMQITGRRLEDLRRLLLPLHVRNGRALVREVHRGPRDTAAATLRDDEPPVLVGAHRCGVADQNQRLLGAGDGNTDALGILGGEVQPLHEM